MHRTEQQLLHVSNDIERPASDRWRECCSDGYDTDTCWWPPWCTKRGCNSTSRNGASFKVDLSRATRCMLMMCSCVRRRMRTCCCIAMPMACHGTGRSRGSSQIGLNAHETDARTVGRINIIYMYVSMLALPCAPVNLRRKQRAGVMACLVPQRSATCRHQHKCCSGTQIDLICAPSQHRQRVSSPVSGEGATHRKHCRVTL